MWNFPVNERRTQILIMICTDWHSGQQLRGFILIMQIVIGLEMKDMIQMIQRHISQRWVAELQMVGILTDLVRQKMDVEIFAQ
mgnify:CR=1 FL=1